MKRRVKDQSRELIGGREKRVAKWIRKGVLIDDIIRKLGGNPTEGSTKAAFVYVVTRDPVLSEALKDKITAIVAENQEQVRNTRIHNLSRKTGVGVAALRAFAKAREIELTPIKDLKAARTTFILGEYAGGAGVTNIAGYLGIGHKHVTKLMDAARVQKRDVPPAPARRPQFQASLLGDIVDCFGENGVIPGNKTLIGLNPDAGGTIETRRSSIQDTKKVLTGKLVETLDDVKGPTSPILSPWDEIRDLTDVPSSHQLQRMRLRLSSIGGSHEDVLCGRVQREINKRFFEGERRCPLDFARRLVRLDVCGDAGEVINPQIPTPRTLSEVSQELSAHLQEKWGERGGRALTTASTVDFTKGPEACKRFYYALERKLPHLSSRPVVHIAIYLLTGEEAKAHRIDWSRRENRIQAVEDLLASVDGNVRRLTTRPLHEHLRGLHSYYRRKGSRDYTDSLIMALQEVSIVKGRRLITPEDIAFFRSRHDQRYRMKLVLTHLDHNATLRQYQPLLSLRRKATRTTFDELERELTAAIDTGESPCDIAGRYDIGARGAAYLIIRYRGGRNRKQGDPAGTIQLIDRSSKKAPSRCLTPRADMQSIEELGGMVGDRVRVLEGIERHRQKPAGRITRDPSLDPLHDRARQLASACGERDFDKLTRLAQQVIEDTETARQTPEDQRRITINMKAGDRIKPITDKWLDGVTALARDIQEEAYFFPQNPVI